MAQVGTFVNATVVAPSTTSANDPATAFVVGLSDWGPVNTPILLTSFTAMASGIGSPAGGGNPYSSRTATCSTAFDAMETIFGEGGYRVYFSRVAHGTPVNASIALAPSAALTITALYPGVGGNAIYVAVQNNTTTYQLTFQDVNGNILTQSPQLSTLAAGITWVASTGYATATSSGSTLPSTAAATAMTGGTDNRGSATVTDWQSALAGFYLGLGPGQVLAPGNTNTTLSGIWAALGTHASANNRIALCDMDDNTAAATLISQMSTFNSSANASYMGFWAGNVQIPGITPGTTRSVSPSAAIAGVTARVTPGGQGNVNQPPAGVVYPLRFATQNQSTVTGTGGAIYSTTDLYSLNDAGINTFAIRNGLFVNYGFVSAILPTTDAIYWQLSHGRTRMSIIADSMIVGEPFVFSQIDGQASDQIAFQSALQNMLMSYYTRGALYGATASDSFAVDAITPNTPSTLQAGQLNAVVKVRLSPFAQKVTINIQAVPITQILA